ncbi:MAG: ribonuclease HI [Eubacteriales bacterium]|nr:ribonuclease HI [Eubacteriales bacterium]
MGKILYIHTDGACSGNQNDKNIGGWGAVLDYAGHRKELHGGEVDTTNNRMELTAVIEAFRCLKKQGNDVIVATDSSYVANCFRQNWHRNWQRNGWMTKSRKPVENKELWQELISLVDQNRVTFYRVKGHVNLTSKKTDINKLYGDFRGWNGEGVTLSDFQYFIEMNNRADALANIAMDEIREGREPGSTDTMADAEK